MPLTSVGMAESKAGVGFGDVVEGVKVGISGRYVEM